MMVVVYLVTVVYAAGCGFLELGLLAPVFTSSRRAGNTDRRVGVSAVSACRAVRSHQQEVRKSMRFARHADTPTRSYADTCFPARRYPDPCSPPPRAFYFLEMSKLQHQDSILLEKAGGFPIVSVIDPGRLDRERAQQQNAWGERANCLGIRKDFLCRMHMTRS